MFPFSHSNIGIYRVKGGKESAHVIWFVNVSIVIYDGVRL